MKIENTDDLKVLIYTARTGSLTRAAAALGVTPSAASAALKRVETQLNARLFERSTRAMRLTEQGRVLLDYAQRAFDLLDEAEAQVGADQAALVGTIRVAAPSDLARHVLLPWFDDFMTLHPGVQLHLHVGDRPKDVVRDEVDMALRYGALADSQLVARTLATPRTVLCAAPAYVARHGTPATPHDLAAHNCLVFMRGERHHRTWHFSKDGERVEVRVSGDRSVDDASLAHEWARAGRGILLKTGIELQGDLASGALVPLLTGWETDVYPLHALLPSGRFIPARVRALADFLAQRFTANPTNSFRSH
jgi:DNA-binding transcriptional LysR family regulator